MSQPFWDLGSTPGQATLLTQYNPITGTWSTTVALGGSTDSLVPDVSVQNVLPDRWAWDVIYMAGWRVPGLAEVEFSREHRVDRRPANGSDGSQVTSLGYKAADVTIKIRMWTPQQFADFQSITIPSIQPRPGKAQARPVAVLVDYPNLAIWGIRSLFVTKVSGPNRTSMQGVFEVRIVATEVNPLANVGTTTQKGGGIAASGNTLTGQPSPTAALPPSQTINTPTPGQ